VATSSPNSPDVGIYFPQVTDSFDTVLTLAQRCERLGFSSLWIYDHLYTPMLPSRPALEGWTLATALLARTETLRVGHLVLNNNLRHPAVLAKMVATLDVISNGRVDLGLGSGSYAAEHDEAGLPFGTMADRSARLGEALAIIDAMLTTGVATFSGTHYQVHDVPGLPLPVQRPRPPVHIGGIGERHTFPLVVRHADVWNVPTYGLDRWEAKAAALAAICESAGRDPATIATSHQAVLVLARGDRALADATALAAKRYPGPGWRVDEGGYVGTPAALVDHIGAMQAKGVSRFIFLPVDRGDGEVLELLAHEVLPHLAN
jgi:alkanesulfonate monooxygenase SsuD/methylene tetrahydromethanopterin reductase-like flavin-dependent oxidoreductase (luciferase family)